MEETKEPNNNIKAEPTGFRYSVITKDGEIETQSLEVAYIIDKLNKIEELLTK